MVDGVAGGRAGWGMLLLQTAEKVGLAEGLSRGLAWWRKPMATHDPGKIVLDLAVPLAIGGDCVSDLALLRAEPGVFGLVASDPTVSRAIAALAADAPKKPYPPSLPRVLTHERGRGRWPVRTPPITVSTPSIHC